MQSKPFVFQVLFTFLHTRAEMEHMDHGIQENLVIGKYTIIFIFHNILWVALLM